MFFSRCILLGETLWSCLDACGIANVRTGLLVSSEAGDGYRSKVVGYNEVSLGRVFGCVSALWWCSVEWWWRGGIDPSKLRHYQLWSVSRCHHPLVHSMQYVVGLGSVHRAVR